MLEKVYYINAMSNNGWFKNEIIRPFPQIYEETDSEKEFTCPKRVKINDDINSNKNINNDNHVLPGNAQQQDNKSQSI